MPQLAGITQYPRKGLPVRDFLKAIKSKNPPDRGELAKKLNKAGLYYTAKNKAGHSSAFEDESGNRFDALVKIGAAGLKEPEEGGARDPPYNARTSKAVMAHNRIPGRMSMYAGHQGTDTHKLMGARTLYGDHAFNKGKHQPGVQRSTTAKGHNRYLEAMEKAAKKELNEQAEKDVDDGLAVAKKAYTYVQDEDNEEHLAVGDNTAEWFLVDWDKLDDKGRSPHQAVMAALNKYQLPTRNQDTRGDGPAGNTRRGGNTLDPNKKLQVFSDTFVTGEGSGRERRWPQPRAEDAMIAPPFVQKVGLRTTRQERYTPQTGAAKAATDRAKDEVERLEEQMRQARARLWQKRGR